MRVASNTFYIRHHSGLTNSRNDARVQTSLQEATTWYRAPTDEVLTTGRGNDNKGSTLTLGQEGDPPCRIAGRLCEQHIHGTEKQWENMTDSQLEESQHLLRVWPFQNGRYPQHQGPVEQEQFHVPKGCIPNSPYSSIPLEIPLFSLAVQGIRVYSPSFWPRNSPPFVYQFEVGRFEADCIPGRFFIIGRTKLEVERAYLRMKSLLERFGFIVNAEKSLPVVTQRIEFLGFSENGHQFAKWGTSGPSVAICSGTR